jgi:hypothetical protein
VISPFRFPHDSTLSAVSQGEKRLSRALSAGKFSCLMPDSGKFFVAFHQSKAEKAGPFREIIRKTGGRLFFYCTFPTGHV